MKKVLGIELGSTRIKAVLIDENTTVLAQGSYQWKSEFKNGFWTYSLDEVWVGLQTAYQRLLENYNQTITTLDCIGVSAMMHGYLAFDKEDNLLVPFRTWQNTNTEQASKELSCELEFNMPQRWSASHYYQAVLNKEEHVKKVAFLTTLAGYVHYKLTGRKVLGVGDASGMFPTTNDAYDKDMMEKYNALLSKKGIDVDFEKLLPKILLAGENAGVLTEQGAKLLDVKGNLKAGSTCCPPEGDAGTGMVATNAIRENTGNVSAGTSAFVMVVMDKPLSKPYEEIDVVATPTGKPVGMVHVNNFTSEINAWVDLFSEVGVLVDGKVNKEELIDKLFKKSIESDESVGELNGYNFATGEPIVGLNSGAPLFIRKHTGKLNLANFMKMQIYSSLGAIALGMRIFKEENIKLESVGGHGGFFKTERVGASAMSAALNTKVTVMKTAGEGGAWGIALLALYAIDKEVSLEEFLDKVFINAEKTSILADEEELKRFNNFIKRYEQGLKIEQLATEVIKC